MSPKKKSAAALVKVQGQPSWRISSDRVEAWLTEVGGQLGPVTFQVGERKVQPFSVAPWAEEKEAAGIIPLLRALRGDFFCLPFGGNAGAWRGEQHPPHGETANEPWRFESIQTEGGRVCCHASLRTKIRPGRVDKRIFLVEGQTVVYSQHVVSGMKGPMDLGHHAMLRFPDEPESGAISTSRFLYGQVFPDAFEKPAEKGYSALLPGAEFTSLDSVPLANGGKADLSRYPARRGFEDLVTMISDPELPFAWTAVAFPTERYVWFALKDPRILRQTVFWISNGGRHYAPWSGRHVGVMGLEEVTAYYAYGLAESAKANPFSKKGFPTTLTLNPKEPLVVPYIMGVAAIPAGFDRVREIVADEGGEGVRIEAQSGRKVSVPLRLDFLSAPAGWA